MRDDRPDGGTCKRGLEIDGKPKVAKVIPNFAILNAGRMEFRSIVKCDRGSLRVGALGFFESAVAVQGIRAVLGVAGVNPC